MAKNAFLLFGIRLRDLMKLVLGRLKRVSQRFVLLPFQKNSVSPPWSDVASPQTTDERPSEVGASKSFLGTPSVHYPKEDRKLSNKPWVKLVEGCVALRSEIDEALPRMNESQQKLARHILDRLAEILQRSGVSLIECDTKFDPQRHRSEFEVPSGTRIVKTLRRGFPVGRRGF